MEAIKETLTNVMQALREKKTISPGDDPEKLLKRVLSKKELGHIKFSHFKKGILSVDVDSSSWLYRLSLEKKDLLAKLSKKSRGIKDVRFRLGEIK